MGVGDWFCHVHHIINHRDKCEDNFPGQSSNHRVNELFLHKRQVME